MALDEDELLERLGLAPAACELDAVRALLADQTARERRCQGDGDTDVMRLCCVQLFSAGELRDVLPIWAAKTASFDAAGAVDVQLLCGAGLEATKRFLRGQPSREAEAALSHVLQCERSGDFAGFSPGQQMEGYRRYYGVTTPPR